MTSVDIQTDIDLIQKLRTLYKLAKSERDSYTDRWRRNYNLLMNRPNTGNRISPQALLGTRSSEIFPILSNINAWMNDQRTTIDISAAADPNSPFSDFVQSIAQDLSTVIETSWEVENYDRPKKLAIWDALLYGTGYIKTVWDQSLAGGLGNAKFVHRSPFSLFIDPNASSLYDAEYVIEQSKMSIDEIERRYPGKSIVVEAAGGASSSLGAVSDKPTLGSEGGVSSPKANPGNLQGAQTRWGMVSNNSPDSNFLMPPIYVYEFWLRENYEWEEEPHTDNIEPPPGLTTKHVRDRWRIIVLAANNILLDEYAEDLWTSDSHPYDEFKFEDVGELYGVSLVDHLANPQIALNELLQALQKNAQLTGNPIWLEPSNSGLSRTGVVNKPGQRLTVNAQAMQGGTGGPRWLTPPEPSKSCFDLIKFYLDRMKEIAGLAAIESDMDKGDRKSADVTQIQQDTGFVRIRNALSNLENTLKSAGNKLCDLIIDNYTESRYVAITGPTGEKTSLVLRAKHFNVPTEKGAAPLKYTLNVTAGSSLPTSRQARAAQANYAYGVGLIDRIAWFTANEYPNWQAINSRIETAIKNGTFQPPGARQRRSKSGGSSQSQ